ncbi:restriction endonuclease subunit S [Micromonospora arida]|uniref:restriction endonuclease subunit S n=1 Tax=Micromonospora arida TaxID=2203715 RepID=UPI003CF99D97
MTLTTTAHQNVRIKTLYRVIDERAGLRRPPLLSVSIHHGVIRRDSVTDDLPRAEDLSNYKICNYGDLVLNRMRAFQGATGVSREQGLVSPDYLVLRPNLNVEARFLHHLFRSTWFIGEMVARLRGIGSIEQGNVRTPRINSEDLGDIRINLPPLAEQRRIADFLDAETSRINTSIKAREVQVKLLRERRFAFVRETLRRGHRSKELQDTPLTWLPACPQDWILSPLKYLVRCLDGRRVPLSAEQRADRRGPYPYYGASAIVDHVDDYLFNEPLVLLGEDGAQLGNPLYEVATYVEGPIWVNNHAHVLRPEKIDGRFLAEILNVFDREDCMSGATREKITQDAMGNIMIPLPPPDEQAEFVTLFDREMIRTRSLRGVLDKQLELLVERRQALITAAVTGQIDVSTASGRGIED